ncbi:hypothetical protein OH76DRAFT_1481861 [Lentinus brumalis]|uniref:Uncharacterized protein n=1 Tax=Lentinus brumalis TaxID=2498619 RepID=A0A371DF79_9APHY|nr:hypothetical protein OH76DRAFT_1481861 [Polyporus brumalis]
MNVRTTASALSRTAPLTHLRLSHIHIDGHEQLDVLGRTLGVPTHRVSVEAEGDGTPAQRDRAHATLPRIREVVWHTVIPYQGGCGNAHIAYGHETAAFERFAQACDDVQGPHVVALKRQQRNFRWRERLYNDWVNRIEGGARARVLLWTRTVSSCGSNERGTSSALWRVLSRWGMKMRNSGGHTVEDGLAAELMSVGMRGGVFDDRSVDDTLSMEGSSSEGAVIRRGGRKCTII